MDTGNRSNLQDGPPIIMPPATPGWIDEDLVRKTLRVWQPYYSGPLTVEDAVEILMNVGQLFGAMGLKCGVQGGGS
jgi:hypothetical protein